MTERCEPPEELRGVDGWHWLMPPSEEPEVGYWNAGSVRWLFSGVEDSYPSDAMPDDRYRYIAPVASPGDVAALVRAGRMAEAFFRRIDTLVNLTDRTLPELTVIAAALRPFAHIPDEEPQK